MTFAETVCGSTVGSCADCLWSIGGGVGGERKSERHREDNRTTKTEGWNSFRGSSRSEQHRTSCHFIGCPGIPFTSHWWRVGFPGFTREQRGVLVELYRGVTKRTLWGRPFSGPAPSPPVSLSVLNYTSLSLLCEWILYVTSFIWKHQISHLYCNRKQLQLPWAALTGSFKHCMSGEIVRRWCVSLSAGRTLSMPKGIS